jgi:hypothetical protein
MRSDLCRAERKLPSHLGNSATAASHNSKALADTAPSGGTRREPRACRPRYGRGVVRLLVTAALSHRAAVLSVIGHVGYLLRINLALRERDVAGHARPPIRMRSKVLSCGKDGQGLPFLCTQAPKNPGRVLIHRSAIRRGRGLRDKWKEDSRMVANLDLTRESSDWPMRRIIPTMLHTPIGAAVSSSRAAHHLPCCRSSRR